MRVDLYKDIYTKEETHWWHCAKRRYVRQLIISHVKKTNPLILDVGCGTGKNMEELSRLGRVWGVDPSPEALSFCSKRGLINIKRGEAERLPFEKNSFDVICALDVLEHVDDVSSLKEIKRVLRDDGFIIITVPAFKWLWSEWDKILHHKRRYSKNNLTDLLLKEGFFPRRITYIHSLFVIPTFIIRKLKQLQKKPYTSDFKINNTFLNTILFFVSKLEQAWINRYDMPFGTSVLCIAQKRNGEYKSLSSPPSLTRRNE